MKQRLNREYNQTFLLLESSTKIISTQTKITRYFDSAGNPIPKDDKDCLNDMTAGRRVVFYHEQKADTGNKTVRKFR